MNPLAEEPTFETVKVIPSEVVKVEQVPYVYNCRPCDWESIETSIITNPMLKPALPGRLTSSSMQANIMNQTYVHTNII
ncbi:hypothetical protein [Effusibacillus lacus]|uniref:hypothetical protein n=1 Tax=Effusibacillus lacus TaxID=1348429 RepID=UPI000BB79029|nr:hypothetical protein [Effusibacillus lacus]